MLMLPLQICSLLATCWNKIIGLSELEFLIGGKRGKGIRFLSFLEGSGGNCVHFVFFVWRNGKSDEPLKINGYDMRWPTDQSQDPVLTQCWISDTKLSIMLHKMLSFIVFSQYLCLTYFLGVIDYGVMD